MGTTETQPMATWRMWGLQLIFLLIAGVMGSMVWAQVLGDTSDWVLWKGVAKAMLAALALVSALGVLHPLKLLPVMLFEIAWKSIWLLAIALPAWAGGTMTPGIQEMVYECIGIVVAPLFVPWRYAWARYVSGPIEPWRGYTATAPASVGWGS